MSNKNDRKLTAWEATISASLSPLGFVYFPHDSGSGYWYCQRYGLYLTNDLEFHSRGVSRCWNLKLVEGLRIGAMRFGSRKRTPETEADEIEGKIQKLFDTPDWQNLKEWGKYTL